MRHSTPTHPIAGRVTFAWKLCDRIVTMQTGAQRKITFRLRALALLACFGLFISALPIAAAFPLRQKVKIWHVTHDTSDFGKVHLWIGKDGVRVELERLGCVMAATPPLWKPVLFNLNQKTRWETTLQYLKKTELYPAVVDYSYRENWKGSKLSYGKIRGVDAVCMSLNTNIPFSPVMGSLGMAQKTVVVRQMRYFYTKSIVVPKEALTVVTSMYRLPANAGIPLALGYTYDDGRKVWGIILLSLKEELADRSLLECPAGYKKVSDHLSVFGQGKSKVIDDMARDLGLGEDFGKKK